MVGQLVMIGTTSTSTLYLHDQGHSVGTIVVAASLPSAACTSPLRCPSGSAIASVPADDRVAGYLIGRVRARRPRTGSAGALVIAGLFLNGIGWNLAFVSASALLTDALSPDDRTSIQGLADLCVGVMGFIGSAGGGIILGVWGFGMLNAVGAAMLILPLAASSMRRAAAAPGRRSSIPGRRERPTPPDTRRLGGDPARDVCGLGPTWHRQQGHLPRAAGVGASGAHGIGAIALSSGGGPAPISCRRDTSALWVASSPHMIGFGSPSVGCRAFPRTLGVLAYTTRWVVPGPRVVSGERLTPRESSAGARLTV